MMVVKQFGDQKVRTVRDDALEEWFFSIIDVVAVWTDSKNTATYWKVLKNRLKKEGNEPVTNCSRLKLQAEDGNENVTSCHGLRLQAVGRSQRRHASSWRRRRGAACCRDRMHPTPSPLMLMSRVFCRPANPAASEERIGAHGAEEYDG